MMDTARALEALDLLTMVASASGGVAARQDRPSEWAATIRDHIAAQAERIAELERQLAEEEQQDAKRWRHAAMREAQRVAELEGALRRIVAHEERDIEFGCIHCLHDARAALTAPTATEGDAPEWCRCDDDICLCPATGGA